MPAPKYTQAQRERFFSLIDRGCTVRAAAKAAVVHEGAAYTRLRQAGLSMPRATPRKYTGQDKAEFFRQLGLNPKTLTGVTPPRTYGG